MLGLPWADVLYIFLKEFRFVARFWVSTLGPFLVPQTWASESGFNTVLIVRPKLGPIFGPISGTRFWPPKLEKKSAEKTRRGRKKEPNLLEQAVVMQLLWV